MYESDVVDCMNGDGFACFTAATVIVPGEGQGVRSGVHILERDGNVIHAVFNVAKGKAEVIAEALKVGNTLVLKGAHISGQGTLREALEAAKAFGREQGVTRVVIEGGIRSTGANPGHIPRPIILETGL